MPIQIFDKQAPAPIGLKNDQNNQNNQNNHDNHDNQTIYYALGRECTQGKFPTSCHTFQLPDHVSEITWQELHDHLALKHKLYSGAKNHTRNCSSYFHAVHFDPNDSSLPAKRTAIDWDVRIKPGNKLILCAKPVDHAFSPFLPNIHDRLTQSCAGVNRVQRPKGIPRTKLKIITENETGLYMLHKSGMKVQYETSWARHKPRRAAELEDEEEEEWIHDTSTHTDETDQTDETNETDQMDNLNKTNQVNKVNDLFDQYDRHDRYDHYD